MRTERWFLGVDGGGTRTTAVLLDSRGRVRGRAGGPPSLRTAAGWVASVRAVAATVRAAERGAGVRPRYAAAYLALAGVDAPADAAAAKRYLRRAFGPRVERFTVVNDAFAAMRAGTAAPAATVVIAGTGSNAYARGPKGEAWAGGQGWILGDDGSGFWIGRAGLRAALRSLDGRGPRTRLWPALARALGAPDLASVHERLLHGSDTKRSVARLSQVVDRTARRGDPEARTILTGAALALASMAVAAARRAGLARSRFPLVVSGGCFRSALLLRTFRARVRTQLPNARIVLLRTDPAIGAARAAKDTR